VALRFAEGDDPDFFMRLRVNESDGLEAQEPERDESSFAIVEAGVFILHGASREDALGVPKVDAVLAQVRAALGFAPCESYWHGVYTPEGRQRQFLAYEFFQRAPWAGAGRGCCIRSELARDSGAIDVGRSRAL